MFLFVGEGWTDEDRKIFEGIQVGKLGGRSFVANPFTLVKDGGNVRIETDRASFRKVEPSTVDGAAAVIKQYYQAV